MYNVLLIEVCMGLDNIYFVCLNLVLYFENNIYNIIYIKFKNL